MSDIFEENNILLDDSDENWVNFEPQYQEQQQNPQTINAQPPQNQQQISLNPPQNPQEPNNKNQNYPSTAANSNMSFFRPDPYYPHVPRKQHKSIPFLKAEGHKIQLQFMKIENVDYIDSILMDAFRYGRTAGPVRKNHISDSDAQESLMDPNVV